MEASGPTMSGIERAAAFLEGRIVRTPLLDLRRLSDGDERRVLVKAEVLQRTGSFKIRGALTFLGLLSDADRSRGVVTYSSGNHGQAVAAAAAAFGVPATVVMPKTAPEVKQLLTRRWGADVVLYDSSGEPREEVAARLAGETGASVVPPYDHPWTIAGQGTLGVELAEQCRRVGVEDPVVLVPTGGGGLCAGIGLALEELLPGAQLHAVEPRGWDDHRLSLELGERVPAPGDVPSICDALLAPIPGAVPFEINRRLLAGALAVSDDEVRDAIRYAFAELRLVTEPAGAVGLAAFLAGHAPADRPIVIVLSGANVDPALFAAVIQGSPGR